MYQFLGRRTTFSKRNIVLEVIKNLPPLVGAVLPFPLQLTDPTELASRITGISSGNLESQLDKYLFRESKLRHIERASPFLIINTTNLGTGNVWAFTHDKMGDIWGSEDRHWFDRGRQAGDYTVSKAVAASAAFPGAFTPVVFPGNLLGVEKIALADGGIIDNQAVIAPLAQGCDFLIISDGSKPFSIDESPPTHAIGVLAKVMELSGVQLRIARLDEAKRVGCAVIELSHNVDHVPDELVAVLSSTPTGLSRLNESQLNSLIGHGTDVTQDMLSQPTG